MNRVSPPGDKVFVGPSDLRLAIANDTFLYYLRPKLIPASRYLEMNPGCANRPGSGLAEQIAKADWIILDTGFDYAMEPSTARIPGPSAPNDVVQNHFCKLSQHDPWVLLRCCERTGSVSTLAPQL